MNLMTPERLAQLNELIVNDNVGKFYRLQPWQTLRRFVLKRDHYECQDCRRRGLHTRANTVHHIKHVRDDPSDALQSTNTEAICKACHNREHPEKLARFIKRKFTNEERW